MTGHERETVGGEPRLSVVVPTHDVDVYVAEMLRSVLRQGIDDMEVIVVDDHSSDGTVPIVESFAAADPRVRIIASPERGGAVARNLGAAEARGTYLIFLDGDDIVPDGALAELVRTLDDSGSDMAAGRYLKFSSTRTWDPTRNWPVYKERVIGTTLHAHPALLRGRPCWNKMFRRRFWQSEGLSFPNVPRSNDIQPITRALVRAKSIDIIPEVVYLYRERPGSGSMTARAAHVLSLVSYLQQELECLREVVALDDDSVTQLYFALLLEADLWVHLCRWVPTADDADDPAARELAIEIVRQVLERSPARVLRKLKPERLTYYRMVTEGRLDLLRGLNDRGEIGNGPAIVDAEAFAAVAATIRGLAERSEDFLPVLARGFLRRIAEPLWAAAPQLSDAELAALLPEVARAGAALAPAARSLIGANAERLIGLAKDGRADLVRSQAAAVARPEPIAIARRVTSTLAEFELSADRDVSRIRLVGVHRDTGSAVVGPWVPVADGVPATAAVRLGGWRELGVWELAADLLTPDGEVRRPVASTERSEAMPGDPLSTITMSRVKHPGHHIVFVRRPALGRRAVGSIVRRARRLIGRR